MSRGSSTKLKSLVNAEYANDALIRVITVEWPDEEVSRYVKGYEPIISRGQTFQPASFDIGFPQEPEDEIPTMVLAFPVADQQILSRLRAFPVGPIVTLELLLGSDLNVVEAGPFVFDVRDYKAQGAVVNVTMGFEPILDLSIPQLNYAPFLFPGLFANISAADV